MSSKGKVKKPKKAWKPDPYLFAAFRRVFRWSPERRACLEKAKRGPDLFQCERCANNFTRKEIAVDHVSPVVDVGRGFSGWDAYANRLFCSRSGLQILCKATCHAEKTKRENALRRQSRKGALLK